MSSPQSFDVNGFDDISTHGECWNCGMPVYDDINICSSCGEHCEEEKTENNKTEEEK